MASTEAARKPVLEGRVANHAWVSVTPAGPAMRLSLRAPAESVASLSRTLGLKLPERPKQSVRKGDRAALWLGPDEWLLIDRTDSSLNTALERARVFHSAVDVSHRNVGIVVEGEGAEATIAAGCPQDISLQAFPVGACARTVMGKIEIALWRTGETQFRVECWRSFADYAFTFLAEAARDASG
jgi:sarcosine oxidase, subunit gamma